MKRKAILKFKHLLKMHDNITKAMYLYIHRNFFKQFTRFIKFTLDYIKYICPIMKKSEHINKISSKEWYKCLEFINYLKEFIIIH